MADEGGRERHPLLVLLLLVATFGFYWFLWLRRAFGEVALRRREPIAATRFLAFLFPIWVLGVAAGLYEYLGRAGGGGLALSGGGASLGRLGDLLPFGLNTPIRLGDPISLAAKLLAVAYFGVQFVYLRRLTGLAARATRAVQRTDAPHSTLPLVFCSLFALSGFAPALGQVYLAGAAALAIIWVVEIQTAINGFWRSAGSLTTSPASMG